MREAGRYSDAFGRVRRCKRGMVDQRTRTARVGLQDCKVCKCLSRSFGFVSSSSPMRRRIVAVMIPHPRPACKALACNCAASVSDQASAGASVQFLLRAHSVGLLQLLYLITSRVGLLCALREQAAHAGLHQ